MCPCAIRGQEKCAPGLPEDGWCAAGRHVPRFVPPDQKQEAEHGQVCQSLQPQQETPLPLQVRLSHSGNTTQRATVRGGSSSSSHSGIAHCCLSGLAGLLTALHTHGASVLICLLLREVKVKRTEIPLFSLPPFLSSLSSRAFLYDHKNRKCQWLSFDRNSPGAQSQQDFNYQLYQKKGAVCCSIFFSLPADPKVPPVSLSFHLKKPPHIVSLPISYIALTCSLLFSILGEFYNSINAYFQSDRSSAMTTSLKRKTRKGKDRRRVYCVAAHYGSFSVIKRRLCKRWKPPPRLNPTDHSGEHASCAAHFTASKCFAED